MRIIIIIMVFKIMTLPFAPTISSSTTTTTIPFFIVPSSSHHLLLHHHHHHHHHHQHALHHRPPSPSPSSFLFLSTKLSCLPLALPFTTSSTTKLSLLHLVTHASMDVPDYLPATWTKARGKQLVGPSLHLTAEEATLSQLEALQANDNPYPDHGVEVLYRFAGLDPFQLSRYFGQRVDLGQFDKFRRIFHHSTYRLLLGHRRRCILSNLYISENLFKQRVLVFGPHDDQSGVFEFTMVQRLGGSWDGYWLTEGLHYEGPDATADI